jgi:hypothetical protein
MHIPRAALLTDQPCAEACKLSVPAPQHAITGKPLRIEGANLVTSAANDAEACSVLGKIMKTVEPSVCRHLTEAVPVGCGPQTAVARRGGR